MESLHIWDCGVVLGEEVKAFTAKGAKVSQRTQRKTYQTYDSLVCSRFEQVGQFLDVIEAGVADHVVAQSSLGPAGHVE